MTVRHRPLQAVVVLVVGSAAAAVGAGVGIRRLQNTGVTLETVGGLALLAVGVVFLGYAAVQTWHGLHGWWRLTLVPAAVVVLVAVLSAAFAVMSAVVPPTALGPGSPADEGLTYRDVTFTTNDGVRLSAWFVPSHNGAAVVLKHGSGSTRTETLRHAGLLARHGYGVLMVDARGHGRSSGAGMDLGWFGEADTTAAVTFLARQAGVSRIGVVGFSMGGEEAVGAAGVDPRIRAVVAEGATGRTAADGENLRPEDYASALERGMDGFIYGLADLLSDASPPASLRDSVAASEAQFFLVAAGTVEKEQLAAASMRSSAPQRVEVWVVPGASHTGALTTAPEEWERRVLRFLDVRLHS